MEPHTCTTNSFHCFICGSVCCLWCCGAVYIYPYYIHFCNQCMRVHGDDIVEIAREVISNTPNNR